MKNYLLAIPLYFTIGCLGLHAQENKSVWFAKNCLFPQLAYDLLEFQPYAGIFYLHSKQKGSDAAYIPVNIGFRKSFFQWQTNNWDLGLAIGAASYTQFEISRIDQNTLKGGLLNTDFKVSGLLHAARDKHMMRIQLFHISSHLGDDYILRNQDYELNDKSVNYEQLDFVYLHSLKNTEFYGGVGYVITPNAFRERWMFQTGLQSNLTISTSLDFIAGTDIKLYEENGYAPDIHAGIGISIKQRSLEQISFLIDIFVGQLPYSTLDYGSIFWVGPSCRIYL